MLTAYCLIMVTGTNKELLRNYYSNGLNCLLDNIKVPTKSSVVATVRRATWKLKRGYTYITLWKKLFFLFVNLFLKLYFSFFLRIMIAKARAAW